MFVKRYIANDMSEALEKIRNELGSEAVILSHRTMRKKGLSGLFKRKIVEVTVAYEPSPHTPIGLHHPPAVAMQAARPVDQNAMQLQQLRHAVMQAQESAQLANAAQRQPAAMPSGTNANNHNPDRMQEQPIPPPATPQAGNPPAEPRRNVGAPTPMQGVAQYQQAAMQARYAPPSAAAAPIAYAAALPSQALPSQALPSQALPSQALPSQALPPQTLHPQSYPAQAVPTPQTQQAALDAAQQANATDAVFEALEFPRLVAMMNTVNSTPDDGNERIQELNEKLLELKSVVKDLTAKILSSDADNAAHFSSEVLRIYYALLEQDVQEALARSICEQVQAGAQNGDPQSPAAATREIMKKLLGETTGFPMPSGKQLVLVLTGPTGVGKTTTLVKLAGMYAIREDVKIGFINADTYRVAAQEQLRIYSEILNIPCVTVYAPDEVPLALHALSDRDIILIDTPGKSLADRAFQDELRELVRESHADEVFLHISASMAANACNELIRYYAFLEDYKLVITKLDELRPLGNVLNIAVSAKKPLAFVTTGQKVPQDIEPADIQGIINRIMEGTEQ